MTFGVEDMGRLPVQNYRILWKEIEYIQKLKGVRFYEVFVSVVEYDGYLKKTFISVFTAPDIQTVYTSFLLCFL